MVGGLQSQFFANFMWIEFCATSTIHVFRRPSRTVGFKFSALVSLQPHPCHSPLVFHATTDHVRRWRHPGPDIQLRFRFQSLVTKLAVETHRAMSGWARSQRVDHLGQANLGVLRGFHHVLKTVLILLLILPPVFG